MPLFEWNLFKVKPFSFYFTEYLVFKVTNIKCSSKWIFLHHRRSICFISVTV